MSEKSCKTKKYTILIIGIVVVLGGLALVFFNLRPNADDTIKKFEKAMRQGDEDALKGILEPANDHMKFKESNIKQMIQFSKENSDYLTNAVHNLKKQEKSHDGEAEGNFSLKKPDGFFSPYRISVRPFKIELLSNEPGTVLRMNGKKVFKTSKGHLKAQIKNVSPGNYTIRGVKKYPFTDVTDQKTLKLFEGKSHNVSLNVRGKQIKPYSFIPDVKIFVNGKDTGKTAPVAEKNLFDVTVSKAFGPVSTDGSLEIYGQKEFPWGVSTSKTITLTKNLIKKKNGKIDITPNPFEEKKARKQIISVINSFEIQRIKALVQAKPSLVTTATKNIQKDIDSQLDHYEVYDFNWKGKPLGTRIDFGRVHLQKSNETYKVSIPVEFHQKLKQEDWSNKKEPLDNQYEARILTLSYKSDKKQWIVTKVENDDAENEDSYMKGKNVVKTIFDKKDNSR